MDISFAHGFETLVPLITFVAGMLVYSILVFKFYRFFSKRDIFKMNVGEGSFLPNLSARVIYFLENIIVAPILIFIALGAMSLMFIILSEEPVEIAILIAAAFVLTVRVSAFYDEALSVDLAKMIPFAMLGVFILNTSFRTIDEISNRLIEFLSNPEFFNFLFFAFILIFIAEAVFTFLYSIFGKGEKEEENNGE